MEISGVEIFLQNIRPLLVELSPPKRVDPFPKRTARAPEILSHVARYDFPLLVSVMEVYARASITDPFKHKVVKYLSLYLRWIASNSRFLGGLYIAGGHTSVNRRYVASRNSIYNRYRHVFPRQFYRQVHLTGAIYLAFQHRNLGYLVSYLKEMFATVNFFKHRFLLYYLRAAFSQFGEIQGVRGLFIKFKGKIAKAGNSRKQRFLLSYGQITTNYSDNYAIEKFQIKTFTGAIGCTIILCYY